MSGESIFRVKLLPDGRLEYEDCRGNVGACPPGELGERIGQVLRDPNLPPVEILNAGGYTMLEAAARTLLPPEYEPLVRAAATPLMQLMNLLNGFGSGPTPRAQAYAQQQTHQPHPPPQPHDPRGTTHRRGRRVA